MFNISILLSLKFDKNKLKNHVTYCFHWFQNSILINKRPTLALFVNYAEDGMAKIVLDGKQWLIKSREIYLNQGENYACRTR